MNSWEEGILETMKKINIDDFEASYFGLNCSLTQEEFDRFFELLNVEKLLDEEDLRYSPLKGLTSTEFMKIFDYLDSINECHGVEVDSHFENYYKCFKYKNVKFTLFSMSGQGWCGQIFLDGRREGCPFLTEFHPIYYIAESFRYHSSAGDANE